MTWTETCEHMNKLVASNAPPILKAHWLVHVLIPKLAAQIGIKEMSQELAQCLCRGLCDKSVTCHICCKRPMDGDDDLCCTCRVEMDQFVAEAGL